MTIPPISDDAIAAMAQGLREVVTSSVELRMEHNYAPYRGSVIASQLDESINLRKRTDGSPWGIEPFRELIVIPGLESLVQGEEFLLCLIGSIEDRGLTFSPYPLVRSALELLAKAWLLFDPAFTLVQRMARGAALDDESTRMVAKLLSEWEGPDSGADVYDAATDRKVRFDNMVGLGLPTTKDRFGKLVIDGGFKGLTDLFVQFMHAGGNEQPAALYNVLSAVSHGTSYGRDAVATREDLSSTGIPRPSFKRVNHTLAPYLNSALWGEIKTNERLAQSHGWDYSSYKAKVSETLRSSGFTDARRAAEAARSEEQSAKDHLTTVRQDTATEH